jgi:hypothetical protein
MGYVMVLGICYTCNHPFNFNPHLVPSVVVDGRREPICKYCVAEANPLREAKGLKPIEILDGAYDPMPESTL